jgi:hypothetical protein
MGAFGLVEVVDLAAAGDLEDVLAARVLDFATAELPALWGLPGAFGALARPEAALLEFFRVFGDIRLPFVAFSGASRELGE